jgi:hypothetical protein
VKLSTSLLEAWALLEKDFTTTAPAVDCFMKYCEPWSKHAVAWDTCGILERLYYNPQTGKYGKGYEEIVKILRECQGAHNDLKFELDPEGEVHALWWGAILTAQIDEKNR